MASQTQPAMYTHNKRLQSLKMHLVLFMVCPIIGNLIYAKWANSKVAARYEW